MKKVILLLLLFLFSTTNTTLAYSVYTHEILSEKATENSKLASDKGDYLKDLGFQNNIGEEVSGKKVIELIKNGSVDEDRPRHERPRNHYHNPLPTKTWEKAGLDDFFTGKSSLVWAQDSENEFSWQAVRRYYLEALTTGSEDSFAKTFKGLGHIIHLLQDTAQPAHVRNDAHFLDPLGLKPRLSPGLETWSKNKPDTISAFASQPVFPAVNLSVSVPGYEPITQFFDTEPDTYDGTNPSTTLSQGLAEYTNANFVSDDTIFTENYDSNHKHYFPFPRKEDTIEYDEYVGDGKYRTYFKKIQNGEAVNHLATIERLSIYLGPWHINLPLFYHLDEQCHEDYTEKLIPRAVGYSTGLIDYFFRGEIEVDLINAESLTIANSSSETMNGIFSLYYDAIDGNRYPVSDGSWTLPSPLQAGETSDVLSFTEPTDFAEDKRYILVFKGALGSESNAVVGKIIDTSYWETWGDTVCENQQWRAWISGNSTASASCQDDLSNIIRDGIGPVGEAWTLNEGVLHHVIAGDNTEWNEGDPAYSGIYVIDQNIEATKLKIKISTEVGTPDYNNFGSIIFLALVGVDNTRAFLVFDTNFADPPPLGGDPNDYVLDDNGGEEQILNLSDYGFINENIKMIFLEVFAGIQVQCSYSLDYIDFYTE